MAMKVGELVQVLSLDNKPHKRGLAEARTGSEREGDKAGRSFAAAFGKRMVPGLMMLAKVSLGAFGAAMAVGAVDVAAKFVGAFLAKAAAVLGPGLAALAALVPAGIGAAVLAVSALKVATAGFGEAVQAGLAGDAEKFTETLKALSPAARFAASAVASLKPQLDALRTAVSDAFWGPFAYQIKAVANIYLPILRSGLEAVAGHFGRAGAALAAFFDTPASARQVAQMMRDLAEAIGNVVAGLPGIVAGFSQLAVVGASFLPGLTSGFSTLTDRFAAWMNEITASGQLQAFIAGGLSGLGDLVKIFGQLSAIVHTVLGAAIDAGLLDAVNQLGAVVKSLVKEAAPGLKSLVMGLVTGLTALAPAAVPVGKALSELMMAVAPLLPLLGNLATVILVALADFLRFAAAEAGPFIRLLSQLGSAILPMLLPVFGQLVNQALPVAQQMFSELSAAVAPLLPLLIKMAKTFIEQLLPVLPMLTEESGPLRAAFVDLVQEIMPLVIQVMPGLIAQIPVLVRMFVIFVQIMGFVVSAAANVIRIITGVVQAFRGLGMMFGVFLNDVRGIPGAVQNIFSGAGHWLMDAGRRIIAGLIDGIQGKLGDLRAMLSRVTSLIPSWKGPLDRDRRLLRPTGAAIMAGLTTGMRANMPQLRGFLGDVTASIAAPASGATSITTPPVSTRSPDGDRMLTELRGIADLLSRLNLKVGPEGLALAVRKGEKSLRYT